MPLSVAGFEPEGKLIVQDEPERILASRGIASHTLSTPALVEVKTHMLARPLLLELQPVSPSTDQAAIADVVRFPMPKPCPAAP